MARTARKITFSNVGIVKGSRVWRNHETGVEIIKGSNFAEVGLYYVCVPTAPSARDGDQTRRMVAHRTTLKGARDTATWYAHHWRAVIAKAITAACLEDSDREGERLMREGDAIREANQMEQIAKWCERHDIELKYDSAPEILAAREADHAEAVMMHLPLGARVSGEIQFRGMDPQKYTGTISTTFTDRGVELTAVNIRTDAPLTTITGRETRSIVLRTPQELAGLRRE